MVEDAQAKAPAVAESTALTVPGRLTAVALSLPDDLDYDTWLEAGARLKQAEGAIQWWLGDWWAFGDHAYGARAQAVREGLFGDGYSFRSLMNYGSMARKFDPAQRRESLSWSHHQAVMGLDARMQRKLLDAAEKDGWPVKKLREKAAQAKAPALGKPHDGREVEAAEDDRAVFDQTAAGDHLAAERAEKLAAFGDQNLTPAGGQVAAIIDAIERLGEPGAVAREIAGGRITPQRLQAAVARLDAVYAQLMRIVTTDNGSSGSPLGPRPGSTRPEEAGVNDTAPAPDEGGGGRAAPLASGQDQTACLQNDPPPHAAPPSSASGSASALVSSFDPDAGPDEEPEIPEFLRRSPTSAYLKKTGEDRS